MNEFSSPKPNVDTPSTTPTENPTPSTLSENDCIVEKRDYQDWFLLFTLDQAKDQKLAKGKINEKVKTKRVKDNLDMDPETANHRLEKLAEKELVQIHKKGRAITYRITSQGKEYLQTLKPHDAFLPKHLIKPDVPEHMQDYHEAYLLLQMLEGESHTLTKTDANKLLRDPAPKTMELTTQFAAYYRHHLAQRGFLEVVKEGRSECYQLTPKGLEELSRRDQYPASQFRFSGRAINDLIRAVRESDEQLRDPDTAPEQQMPDDLKQATYEEFLELLRERHSAEGLVPIHEIREQLRAKYGDEAGRHDLMDEAIRQLWRDGKVRMLPISDPHGVTQEQLNDSIQGVNETLFYLEAAHVERVPS